MAGRPTPPAARPPGGRADGNEASGLRTPLVSGGEGGGATGGDGGGRGIGSSSFDAEAAAAATAAAWPGLGGGDDDEDDLLLGPGGSGPGSALRRALAGRSACRTHRRHASRLNPAREPAAVNHRYSPAERACLAAVEGIEYLPPDSAVYRRWLAGQPHGRQWDRWAMMTAIGVSVGLLGAALKATIAAAAGARIRALAAVASRAGAVPALLLGVAWSAGLAGLAAWPVYAVAPQAAGAGVAEVMAYLNGCVVPKIFSLSTLAVKFASCAAAVSAGLPVGPEGPMVHMGALIGGGLSQGVSTTLGVSAPAALAPTRFRNPKDKRDFVAAGTAVGIAAAFGAPIGGLLFAFEELAVPFSPALAAQILAAAAAAVLALNTARSFAAATFGALDGDASPVFFEVRTQLANHVAAMVPAAGLGAVCGAAAAAFTAAVLAWTRARDAWLSGPAAPRRARLLEPIAIAAAFTAASLLLAGAWPCTAAGCVLPPAAAVGEPAPACPSLPPPAAGPAPASRAVVADAAVAVWTCGRRRGGPPPVPAPGDPAWTNASSASDGGGPAALAGPLAFNEFASLAVGTGEDTIRRLLSRGTHREFGYAPLLAWLALYAGGAVASAAAGVASGLFVPMLAMGAAIGRLAGRAAVDVAAHFGGGSAGAPPGVFMPPSPWAWLDPGAFALIGAGAFLGGVTRLTVAAAVIMMEVSNDARSLLPLLVSILAAKAVADAVVHPLYHGLLAAKCVPWLPGDPVCGVPLDLVPASAAAASPVAVADVALPASALRALLRDTAHHGFPVVRAGAGGSVYLGLVSRETCLALLRRAAALGARGAGAGGVIPYEDLNRRYVSAAARSLLSEQQLAVLSGGGGGGGGGSGGGSSSANLLNGDGAAAAATSTSPPADDPVIDLSPYVNTSAPAVPESFSLGRAYALFVRLGLRHLPVVDGRNRVVGMLTRKDLLGCRLDDAAGRALGSGDGGGEAAAAAAASSPAWAGARAGGRGGADGGGVAYGF